VDVLAMILSTFSFKKIIKTGFQIIGQLHDLMHKYKQSHDFFQIKRCKSGIKNAMKSSKNSVIIAFQVPSKSISGASRLLR
jgi:hypothetical protein